MIFMVIEDVTRVFGEPIHTHIRGKNHEDEWHSFQSADAKYREARQVK